MCDDQCAVFRLFNVSNEDGLRFCCMARGKLCCEWKYIEDGHCWELRMLHRAWCMCTRASGRGSGSSIISAAACTRACMCVHVRTRVGACAWRTRACAHAPPPKKKILLLQRMHVRARAYSRHAYACVSTCTHLRRKGRIVHSQSIRHHPPTRTRARPLSVRM